MGRSLWAAAAEVKGESVRARRGATLSPSWRPKKRRRSSKRKKKKKRSGSKDSKGKGGSGSKR
jgi:hypothetical protein